MSLLHPQLVAFMAVLEEGTFDAAAQRLSVTPSAISQRIKALEDRLGQVLILRNLPVRPSPAGERLLRRVRPMQTLEAEAITDFSPSSGAVLRSIPIAINEDSLQTWATRALADLHSRYGYMFDVRVDDQDHTVAMLRDGTVLAAMTSQSKPIQGCNVTYLGSMRYLPIASTEFARKFFPVGLNAESLNQAPVIVFNRKDDLQWRLIKKITRARTTPPVHYLPSSVGFLEAAALGLGWCLAPEQRVTPAVKAKKVEILDTKHWLDLPLYWQYAAVHSETLDNVTRGMTQAAARALV